MKVQEFDKIINEVLLQETKKLIMEQVANTDKIIDSIKKFQTLSTILDKIDNVEDISNGDIGIIIYLTLTPEELIDSCGGESLGESQKNLMQGLHHDLEDGGFGNNFDIDIDTQGDENILHLNIKITANNDELSGDTDMKENTRDTNPTVEKKKNMILGSEDVNKEEDLDEVKKWIQKAINPKHKGYCTPMTKKTCTPKRKALAKRFKKGIEKESVDKKTITLNEEQMKKLLEKIVSEAAETMDSTTEKAISDSGKENADYLAAVEKKIKDYLSFKGNDNPEFPNQIGKGEEKAARQNSDEQDELVDIDRGRGPQDLDYDTDGVDDNGEPGKKFQDRLEKALTGDSTMGNSQDAVGVVKTDTGKKIVKSMKKRRAALRKEPIYPKEAVPVDTKPEPALGRPVNEEKENAVLKEELERMKQMVSYNKKTQ